MIHWRGFPVSVHPMSFRAKRGISPFAYVRGNTLSEPGLEEFEGFKGG